MVKTNAINNFSEQLACGLDAEGTTSSTVPMQIKTDQAAPTLLRVRNDADDSLAQASVGVGAFLTGGGTQPEGIITVGSDTFNGPDTGTLSQNRMLITSNSALSGITYLANKTTGDHRWYYGTIGTAFTQLAQLDLTSGFSVDNLSSLTTDGNLQVRPNGTGLLDLPLDTIFESNWAVGDILYADTTTSLAKLNAGDDGDVLTLDSGIPAWAPSSGGGSSSSAVTSFSDCMSVIFSGQVLDGILYYQTNGSGANVLQYLQTNQEPAHPGVYQLSTGTTSSGFVTISGPTFTLGGGTWDVEWLVRIPTLSTSSQRFTVFIGLGDSIFGTEPTSGCYFLYSDNINSGNWQAKTAAVGSRTTANSSVAVSAATWVKLKVSINAGATSVSFYVDGVEISNSPLTATIPTLSIYPQAIIAKSVGSTARTLDLDYMSLNGTLTTAR